MSGERILRGVDPGGSGPGRPTVLVAPAQTLLSGEEQLRVRAWSSQPGVRVQIGTRFRLPDGTIQAGLSEFTPTADRLPSAINIPMTAGYLLNVVVRTAGTALVTGQCYVTVSIARGDTTPPITVAQLLGGYVTPFQMLGWPGSPITPATDGSGWLFTQTDSSGVPGTIYEITVPAGARWRLNSISTFVITDATPLSRTMALAVGPFGGGVMYLGSQPLILPPSTNGRFTWARGLVEGPGYGGFGMSTAPIPADLLLTAGATIDVIIEVGSSGDTFSDITWSAIEWLEAS